MFNGKAKDVCFYYDYSLLIDNNDNLYGSGVSDNGEFSLGHKDIYNIKTLTKTEIDISDMKEIRKEANTTYIINNDGTVDAYGQIRHLDTINKTNEEFSMSKSKLNITNVKEITIFNDTTLFVLKNDGTLWACGDNSYGECGLGHLNKVKKFTQVPINNVKKIECGVSHAFILKNDGTIWGAGMASSGRLSMGDPGSSSSNYVKQYTQIKYENGEYITGIEDIMCGQFHTLILRNDGKILATGPSNFYDYGTISGNYNYYFKEFTGISIDEIENINMSWRTTIILKKDGTVWAAGRNNAGELGVGHLNAVPNFTQVASNVKKIYSNKNGYHVFLIKNDGSIEGAGYSADGRLFDAINNAENNNTLNFTKINLNENDFDYLYAASYSTLLRKDNILYGIGSNYNNRLIIPSTPTYPEYSKIIPDKIKKMCINDNYSVAILKNDGTLWGAGNNSCSELGLSHDTKVFSYTLITDNVKDVWLSEYNIYVLKNDDSFWAGGANWCGELCTDQYKETDCAPLIKIEENMNIKKLFKGQNWSENIKILKNDGTLWCSGWNSFCFGNGNTKSEEVFGLIKTAENIKDVFDTSYYTFAIFQDDYLYVCGQCNYPDNSMNPLGLGNTKIIGTFTKIEGMNNVKKVVGDYYSTYILKNDGTVWSCGDNECGQLGLGDMTHRNTFTQIPINNVKDIYYDIYTYSCFFVCDDGVYFSGINTYFLKDKSVVKEYYSSPTLIDIDEKINTNQIKKIHLFDEAAVILMDNGDLFICGNNGPYNLGFPLSEIGNNKNVYGFTKYSPKEDSNKEYSLTIDDIVHTIVSTDVGDNYEILKTNDNRYFVKGDNSKGQLGLNNVEYQYTHKETFLNTNPKSYSCGDTHNIFIDDGNILYGTGSNSHGQLGNSSNNTKAYIQLATNVEYAKAIKNLTIIKKDGKIYVAGESYGDKFTPYF